MPELPTVSALVAAYNYERYVERALERALTQDYPPELIEIVVVDDGSTDATAAVVEEVAARHPERRIKLIRQANGGLTSATNTALRHADGELLAILDADDAWLEQKTRHNVAMLLERPELGLVFSDMAIVGPGGEHRHDSLFQWAWRDWRPPRGAGLFARLLTENFVTASSIVVRASLRGSFDPVPDDIPFVDWWLATSTARVAEIDYTNEVLAHYRLHGANLTGGVTGARASQRERRKDIAFQRWCLRNLPLDGLSAAELEAAWNGLEQKARSAVAASGTQFVALADVDEIDRELAAADAAEAIGEVGDPPSQAVLLLRALAADPFRPEYHEQFREAVTAAAAVEALPDPLAGARRFVALADAEELLGDTHLLQAFAAEFAGRDDVTLAIDASRLDGRAAAADLNALIERCGVANRPDLHLIAVVGNLHPAQRRRLVGGAHAFYGTCTRASEDAPRFTPDSLRELRALAA